MAIFPQSALYLSPQYGSEIQGHAAQPADLDGAGESGLVDARMCRSPHRDNA
jgi:hypothetical protein